MAKRVLVVANRTVGGRKLLESVRSRAAESDTEFHLVVPLSRPRHGSVIYDHAERDAAQLRINLSHDFLKREGVDITGEVGDEDPFTATLDAVATFAPDEIIVSTLPETRSGWLRRDLVERIQDATDIPVTHVVSDIDAEGLPFDVTLVIANVTAGRGKLRARMKEIASETDDALFIVVVPLQAGDGRAAADRRSWASTWSTGLPVARRTRSTRSARSQPDRVAGSVEITTSSSRKSSAAFMIAL